MPLALALLSLLMIVRYSFAAFSTYNYLITLSRNTDIEERHQQVSTIDGDMQKQFLREPPILTSHHQDQDEHSVVNLEFISAQTPDDHYAKHNPGAGWAG